MGAGRGLRVNFLFPAPIGKAGDRFGKDSRMPFCSLSEHAFTDKIPSGGKS